MIYAGDVEPVAAYEAVKDDPDAVLVDVRTRPELAYVGYPDLSGIGKQIVPIEWQVFPTGQQNPDFVRELEARGIAREQPVYFICRSGQRSMYAAALATAAGWETAYNVAHGFEGPVGPEGHRGAVSGWKVDGLPWRQS